MPNQPNTPIVVIACAVFQDLLENLMPEDLAAQVAFLDYGLHSVPANLAKTLQTTIDKITEPSFIVLGYGLCGNGLNDIHSGIHTLLVPRADDCIAILLGSYQAYRQEFDNNPGTYYLTKGWLKSGSDPLREYEALVEKYGTKKADWLMDMQYKNYKRLVLVAHSQKELETYRPRALEVAKYCEHWGMRYEEILGSDLYIRSLIEAALHPSESNQSFLLIPGNSLLVKDDADRPH